MLHTAETLDCAAQQAARRIALAVRLTPAQVAEHNRFIDEMRAEAENDAQAFVSQPSRFVGVKTGLPSHATC